MPRVCSICTHPARAEIGRQLLNAIPNRRIASQFALVETSVRRHRADHLPERLTQAKEARDMLDASELLQQVRGLYAKSLSLLTRAEQEGDIRVALAGIGQARACLELLMEAAGELDRRPVTNITLSAEWIELRAVIISALETHPDARDAVVTALGAGA